MNSQAKTVLWLGLFMIIAAIITHWSEISAVLFSSSGPVSGGGDVKGNPPTTIPMPGNGKCPPGYAPQSSPSGVQVCRLHSRLPL